MTKEAVLVDMPTTIRSFVRRDADGYETVVINARLSYEEQRERYRHEDGHVQRDDLSKEGSADAIEREAHT